MTTTAWCPACRHADSQVVDFRCAVCTGAGTVELAPAALAETSPGVVADAILCGLALMAGDESTPLAVRVRDLHDGGLMGNRGRGLAEVEDADEDATRLGLLYSADAYARRGDLGRVATLIQAAPASAEQTHTRR